METLSARELKPLLTSADEIAFVDVREFGSYGEGHPFFSINIPYSVLELRAPQLIPRKTVRIVLFDDGDGIAQLAAERLRTLGYSNIAVLEGGAAGWRAAGYTLFDGVNLPSKAFGELVEHAAHTPRLKAEEFVALQASGKPHLLLDGRTPREFTRMNIPGGRHCANAELGYRLPMLADDETLPIIINCAGRTRSIIGAQSLINLGIPNPVYALENGTQGWELAGFSVERGNAALPLPTLSPNAHTQAATRADALLKKFALPTLTAERLAQWRTETSRTLYLLDVRTQEEFAADSLPGAAHAPGGQLVQATDEWVAVRGARIVVYCDTNLRAAQTAYWLRSQGHDAFVLLADELQAARQIPAPQQSSITLPPLPVCTPTGLSDQLSRGAQILDLRSSTAFRTSHIMGALWTTRPKLQTLKINLKQTIILAGLPDKAALAAIDLKQIGAQHILHLSGGPAEWQAAGLETTSTPNTPPDSERIDFMFHTHDRHTGNLDAARAYIAWELALLDQLDEQERGVFKLQF